MAVAFQLGIDSTSPTITYNPSFPNVIAQDATAGWTPYYTDSGFPSSPGMVGNGTGLQISSKNGSSFSVTWFGTGIDLYGNATRATFELKLDREGSGGGPGDIMVGPSSNILASFSNLPLDTYTLVLTANTSSSPSSFIAFERAVITSAVKVTNSDNLTVQSETVDDARIAYEGLWTTFQGGVIAPDKTFHVTHHLGDTAQLTFNGTAVSVFGIRDPIAGYYNVTLDGETTQYTAQSVWEEGTVLFYMTGLDPGRTHSLIITNAEDNLLTIGYINITSVSGIPPPTPTPAPTPTPTPSADLPKGAIAGIVVGIFLGVVIFPVLGFVFWRRRRRRYDKNLTFIEPTIHKSYDITETLDIHPGAPGQRRRPPTQSPVSGLSLDLFPLSVPQPTRPWSRVSPPTFPRSPTPSSPSPTKDNDSHGVRRSPVAKDRYPSVHVQNPPTADLENTPSPSVNRRSSVPKPSGPRPLSYRTSSSEPRPSIFASPPRIVIKPSSVKGKEPAEPSPQEVNEEGGMMAYSFLDMNTTSGPPSVREGPGKSRSPIPPLPQTSPESPHHPPITRSSPDPSHRDPEKRRESSNSKQLSLSAVIRQLPNLKFRQSAELHPYSPQPPPGHSRYPQSHRPQTGGASPTESVPLTTSEVSEIRFCSPGEVSDSNVSQKSGRVSPPPSVKATTVTSPIYQKLFGTPQGEAPADGLLAKKRPLRRKQLSTSTFTNTTFRT